MVVFLRAFMLLHDVKVLDPLSHIPMRVIKVIDDLCIVILWNKLLLILQFLKIHVSINLMTFMLCFSPFL